MMKIKHRKNLVNILKGFNGTKAFRHLWVDDSGVEKDIVDGGDLSCAFFVSSVLCMFNLIKSQHATVSSTLADMKDSGYKEIKEKEVGCVLVWEEKNDHQHVGFYLGDDKAISNDPKTKLPIIHHFTFEGTRDIVSMWDKEF